MKLFALATITVLATTAAQAQPIGAKLKTPPAHICRKNPRTGIIMSAVDCKTAAEWKRIDEGAAEGRKDWERNPPSGINVH